jgi:hypothetical protein
MKRGNRIQRAAMAAVVAAVLAVSVQQANAGVHRYPADTPSSLLPLGRAKVVDGGSGWIMANVRILLASVRLFPAF